ncbi:dihydrofolate reductase family protein [Aeromicrobium sp. YIM 150415]|uniref:dihydrofolate reductase family protein n=1 Tax=Aeromicrobium sp. YIM 150415 TaxID=2803912 RepID=UPI00196587E4|nr:dihydrofolate reductase family protein [Aeromicrobium sp. YIM 150415]MBM9465391.1 dihydrofolate reductase family protein [Aeromicrobium sp. YIM 150415]
MELMVDYITSLDGYGAADGWPGWWGLEGPEYLAWLEEDSSADRTLLMGAKTYRLMHGFASTQTEGVDALGAVRKVVFSNTLEEPLAWENSRLIRGDAVDAVRELKQTSTHPLSTIGSLTLSRSLLRAGLVDRFRVVVFPVITGKTGQERVYDGYPDLALDLIAARTFDRGTQLLDYRPRVLDAPLPPGPGSAFGGTA